MLENYLFVSQIIVKVRCLDDDEKLMKSRKFMI